MNPSQKYIVVDANAFIHCSQLRQLGIDATLCTTSSVLNELKDQKTKDLINSLPYELKVELPSAKAIKTIKEFARKTGDIVSLSEPDIEIIALAYDYCEKLGLLEKLNKEPKQLQEPTVDQTANKQQEQQGQDHEHPEQQSQNDAAEDDLHQQEHEDEEEEDDGWITVESKKPKLKQIEEDDDDGWITPENYHEKKQTGTSIEKTAEQQKEKDELPVSVMTSDFSMQNVILQMGINLISIQGVEVKSVRRFIVQCYLCWKQYPEMKTDKIQTCGKCGYNSLSKIAYSLDNHGNMILHRKKGWKPNKKVQQWKERKLEEQARYKRNQRKKAKKVSIFS